MKLLTAFGGLLAITAGFAAAFNVNNGLALARRHEDHNSVITVTSISTVTVCDSANPILNPPPQTPTVVPSSATSVSTGPSESPVAPSVSSVAPVLPPSETVPPVITTTSVPATSVPATATIPYSPSGSGVTSTPGAPTTSPQHTENPAKPSSSAPPAPPKQSSGAAHGGINASAGALVAGGMALFMAAV